MLPRRVHQIPAGIGVADVHLDGEGLSALATDAFGGLLEVVLGGEAIGPVSRRSRPERPQVADHDARITNPNASSFFVLAFNDARKNRYGTWAEWEGDIGDAWEHADWPDYPENMTALAYRFGINYLIYAMTH